LINRLNPTTPIRFKNIIGNVDLYANGNVYDGFLVGSTVGGKRDDQLQIYRASRLVNNKFAYYNTGDNWTTTLWFNLKDNGATSATFEIIRARNVYGYKVAVNARRINTGDNAGQYEVYCVINNTEQTIMNVSPNAYHFCSIRADSGTITVDIDSNKFEMTETGATEIHILFLSSESQFDASANAIFYDELYVWNAALTDGNVAYIFNAGIGRFVDRLTGQWEGTIDLPNPVWAAIASDTPTDDLVANHDITGSDGEISNGKNGKAIYYDGTSFVGLHTTGPAITTGEVSISCWVKLSGVRSSVLMEYVGISPFYFQVDSGTSNAAT
jgi:hypothetical protein